MLKSREFYLNNAGDDDVSVAELADAIIAGVVSLDELRYPLVPFNKWEAIQKQIQSNNHQKESPPSMPLQSYEYYLENVESTEAKELAEAILAKIISFEDLQDTMLFSVSEQRKVRDILDSKSLVESTIINGSIPELESLLNRKSLSTDDKIRIEQRIIALQDEEEASAFNSATTVKKCEDFIQKYPNSKLKQLIEEKIKYFNIIEINEQTKLVDDILLDIHKANPKSILEKYGETVLRTVCDRIALDYNDVINIGPVSLENSGNKPQNDSDIPENCTDVFFWGLPSSGKSCALASIFHTIKKEYAMINPDKGKIYGAPYRNSLSGIFNNQGIGILPKGNAVAVDDTHYMNFVLKLKESKNCINLSFLEISGEIFKYFNELAFDSKRKIPEEIEPTIKLLNSILKSKNPKIHFFFIDYQQENDQKGFYGNSTQQNYLEGAAAYFNRNHDIFKHHTLSIHIVITKADLITGNDRRSEAEAFLNSRFGNFIQQIKHLKKKNNITNETFVFPFSIGDVYFNSMCRLNTADPKRIVDRLLYEIKPQNRFFDFIKSKFNK